MHIVLLKIRANVEDENLTQNWTLDLQDSANVSLYKLGKMKMMPFLTFKNSWNFQFWDPKIGENQIFLEFWKGYLPFFILHIFM